MTEYETRLAAAHAETKRISREYIKGNLLACAAFALLAFLAAGVIFSR